MVCQAINNCQSAVQDLINETVGATIACCGSTAYRVFSHYHTPEQPLAQLAYEGRLGRLAQLQERIARIAQKLFAEPLLMIALQFCAPALWVLSGILVYEIASFGSSSTSRSKEFYSACTISSGAEATYLMGKILYSGLVAASRVYVIGALFALIHSSYCSYRAS